MAYSDHAHNLIYVIAGPTASGKSAHALDLAHAHNGAIINADSLQVYADLPVLTAQPSQREMQDVPHYLYGILGAEDLCSAGLWRERAMEAIETVLDQGRAPIIVGGSGLYLSALINGLSPIPRIPAEIRARANAMLHDKGVSGLFDHLQTHDPETTARLDPNNGARLVRAWEVLEATGRSLAYWQDQPRIGPPAHWHFDTTLILPPRDILHKRCNTRFDQMLASGALDEAASLHTRIQNADIDPNAPVTRALGLRQLHQYLDGTLAWDEACARAKAATRQYAKRQITWFRNQMRADTIVDKADS